MRPQRLLDLISLGNMYSPLLGSTLATKIAPNTTAVYKKGLNEFAITKESNVNGIKITSEFQENGKSMIEIFPNTERFKTIRMFIVYVDERLLLHAEQSAIDFCLDNGIIQKAVFIAKISHTFNAYDVKFGENFVHDFAGPEIILKYFKKSFEELYENQPHGVMFLDLEIETI